MRHSGLDELQARIKISGRNNNNHRYVDDISLIAESKEKLKSHLMKVVDESKGTGLRLNIKKQNKQTNKKKRRSWHLAPLLHGKWRGKTWK